MSVNVVCITIDCREPRRVAEFWAGALDWRVAHVADDGAIVQAPDRAQPYLEFIVVPEPKTLKNRVHLGLSTAELDRQIDRLVSMGAEVAWEEEFPPGTTYRNVILRDPEGNEFCLGSTSDAAPMSTHPHAMKRADYERELALLQRGSVKLQEWVRHENLKVCVLFEGRDAAGKGGTIKRITERTNPRVVRVVALAKPSDRERSQWYFQRYAVEQLPAGGEIVLFDRSWYNRAGVEHVMGFCTQDEYEEFLHSCPEFEQMLIRAGIVLVKYWFSVSDAEQEHRFQDRIKNPEKRWKLSSMDLESRAHWADYSRAKDTMFEHTDIPGSPWWVVDANDKRRARLNCIHHLLSTIPYQDVTSQKLKLPPCQVDNYVRPPVEDQTFVPQVY